MSMKVSQIYWVKLKKFNDKTRQQTFKKKQMKEDALDDLNNFYEASEMVLNGFKSKIFLIKSTGTGPLILIILNLKY